MAGAIPTPSKETGARVGRGHHPGGSVHYQTQENDMSEINYCEVSIEDAKKHVEGDQFSATRKVRVELHSSVGEGEDADTVLADVANKANAKVAELLGLAAPTVAVTTATAKARGGRSAKKADAEPATTAAAASVVAEPKSTGRTKADLEAEMIAAAAKPAKPETASAAAVVDEDVFTTSPTAAAVVDEDIFTASPPAVATQEITDAELTSAVTRKNAALQAPALIRGLIANYNPDPTKAFQVRQIDQASRRQFLDELEALKKA